MNRRNFLKNSALSLFGFAVLPPATTYNRIWKAQKKPVLTQAVIDKAYRELNPVFDPVTYTGIVSTINIPDGAPCRKKFRRYMIPGDPRWLWVEE